MDSGVSHVKEMRPERWRHNFHKAHTVFFPRVNDRAVNHAGQLWVPTSKRHRHLCAPDKSIS